VPARRNTTDMMVKVCVKVFMLLLIYGERSGVNRTECRIENVEHRRNSQYILNNHLRAEKFSHILRSTFYIQQIRWVNLPT